MLKNGLEKPIVDTGLERSVTLLILVISVLLMTRCAGLNKNAEIETTPVRVAYWSNQEFWCLEKTDFTAVLQEAERCK